jgi:Family of unknown function (DUF6210)
MATNPDAIDLDERPNPRELGLLAVDSAGKLYGRQGVGHNCWPMSERGWYVALRNNCPEIEGHYTDGPPDGLWRGWGALWEIGDKEYPAKARKTADFLDTTLANYGLGGLLRVQRDSRGLPACIVEAWVSVEILERSTSWPAGVVPGLGILTWHNSD